MTRPLHLERALGFLVFSLSACSSDPTSLSPGGDAIADSVTTDSTSDAPLDDSGLPPGDDGSDVASDAQPEAPPPCVMGDLSLAVATLTGCDNEGTVDGARGVGLLSNPVNVAVGRDGVTYVADFDSDLLRAVDASGAVTTIISRHDFVRPFGLAIAADGTLFVETDDDDLGQHSIETGTIWRVDPAAKTAQVVVRDVGRPRGLAVLSDGRVAMADYSHHVVQLLTPSTGAVAPLAGAWGQPGHVNGQGGAARFEQPYDVVVLPSGDLVVSDLFNGVLRKVTLAGVVTDFAGSGAIGDIDGPVATATFNQPKGLAIGADGAVYVTDPGNHDVRRIRGGEVVKIAGSQEGFRDSDAPLEARFYGIEGVDVAADGRLLLSDGNGGDGEPYHRVRVVHLQASTIAP